MPTDMLTDATSQPLRALAQANDVRTARAGSKAALRYGRLSLPDALADPPDALKALPLWELLRLAPQLGVERCAKINRRAVLADVNLALPLGRASQHTRRWLTATLTDQDPDDEPAEPVRLVFAEEDPRAAQLAQAIAAHRTAIRGPSPTTEFGAADDLLYHRCAEIMATGVDERTSEAA